MTDEVALDEALINRFDYDEVFGTVLNRFCAQAALGYPLTVYGKGGQTRGFLDIRDTVRCVELACLNPAGKGEFRVFNQFTEQFRCLIWRTWCRRLGKKLGLRWRSKVCRLPGGGGTALLQCEAFEVDRSGLQPHFLSDSLLDSMIDIAVKYRERIDSGLFLPRVQWRNTRNDRRVEKPVLA